MLIKILGILDILAALSFWLFGIFGIIPSGIILFFAIYLLVKGIVFLISEHVASVIDILIAVIMFLSMSFHVPNFLVIIASLFLIQKGVISFF